MTPAQHRQTVGELRELLHLLETGELEVVSYTRANPWGCGPAIRLVTSREKSNAGRAANGGGDCISPCAQFTQPPPPVRLRDDCA